MTCRALLRAPQLGDRLYMHAVYPGSMRISLRVSEVREHAVPDLGPGLNMQCIRKHENHVREFVQNMVHCFGYVATAPANKLRLSIRICSN
jgi:hypothetical protein